MVSVSNTLGFESTLPKQTLADKIRAFMEENKEELYANAVTGWFEDCLADLAQQESYEPDSREIALTLAEVRRESGDL